MGRGIIANRQILIFMNRNIGLTGQSHEGKPERIYPKMRLVLRRERRKPQGRIPLDEIG